MAFDSAEGLYVFEVVLGYGVDGETKYSGAFLVQADDPDEAEEKTLEYLDDLDLDHDFWIEEMGEPHDIEEYDRRLEESEQEPHPLLHDMSEEEFQELLGD